MTYRQFIYGAGFISVFDCSLYMIAKQKSCGFSTAFLYGIERKSSFLLNDLLALVISARFAYTMSEYEFTALRALYHAGKVELPYA